MDVFGECRSVGVAAFLGLIAFATPLPHAEATDGPTVAKQLNDRYMDKSSNCGTNRSPAFVCSGVLIRATVPGQGKYHTWNPSPSSVELGAVSFSWLRQDAKFRTVYTLRYSNGFIFLPKLAADKLGYRPMEVLCVYPLDAHTANRSESGCGSLTGSPDTRRCAELGIATGSAWVASYRKSNSYQHMCSFNVAMGTANSAEAFQQMAAAMALLPERFQPVTAGRSYTNELMVRTWPQDIHATMPIEAFFYQAGTANGLQNAKDDQTDFFDTADRLVPVIRMTMPGSDAEDVKFEYLDTDQYIKSATASTKPSGTYIQSGKWVERYDPGTTKYEWSLYVTPTDTGRAALSDTTDAVYAELVRMFAMDPQWKDNDRGGMRRQLVCHFVTARTKPTWNLEPFRPNVTEAVAEAAGCNPL